MTKAKAPKVSILEVSLFTVAMVRAFGRKVSIENMYKKVYTSG